MKIIAIINQKGGIGKTTTAAALVTGLVKRGLKVLAIDLDPQCNLSSTQGADMEKPSIIGVLMREVKAGAAIQKSARGDVIPANKALSAADMLFTETGKEFLLREALEPIKKQYDYIIIDTPPALGILTINAMTAANSIIIPLQADLYSLQGLEQVIDSINQVKKYTNPKLKIEGLLFTRFNTRATISGEVLELCRGYAAKLNTRVFDTTIREATAVKESQFQQMDILSYAPKSKVSEDYTALVSELLEGTS